MQQHYPLLVLTLCTLAVHLHARHPADSIVAQTTGHIVRVSGQLVEQHRGRPIRQATVLIKSGERVLDVQQTDEQGNFVLHVPPEQIATAYLTLKIRWRDHVFLSEVLAPVSQELHIELNPTLFVEEAPIEDYRMPVHCLDSPRVGRVVVRTANQRQALEPTRTGS
ncbi:MAG: hypothetical protein OHK0039_21440 [Bacteroidia bacterium]